MLKLYQFIYVFLVLKGKNCRVQILKNEYFGVVMEKYGEVKVLLGGGYIILLNLFMDLYFKVVKI